MTGSTTRIQVLALSLVILAGGGLASSNFGVLHRKVPGCQNLGRPGESNSVIAEARSGDQITGGETPQVASRSFRIRSDLSITFVGLSLLKQDVTRAIEDRCYISGDQLAGRVT